MKILIGHTSEATAFLQPDYPYSFNLRCERRVWVETNGKGQRIVFQTSNPKKPGVWNKPKASTYSAVIVMYLNEENGHVEHASLSGYDNEEKVEKFATEYAEGLTGKYELGVLKYLRAAARVSKRIEWKVGEVKQGEPVPDFNEQARQYGDLVRAEMKKG